MSSLYRKKPVVVEAIRWTGDNLHKVIEMTGLLPPAKQWMWEEYEQVVKEKVLKIFTPSGPVIASIGDWIIKDAEGEVYPCKPDIFEKTYEPVEE